MPTEPSLDDLRRHAVARTLFTPTTLPAAIQRLGFVQADPIRAPARAQDLTLRHRVKDYRAGDLERRYARLAIDEDCLVNYGFLPSEHLALMHPRQARKAWDAETQRKAASLIDLVVRTYAPLPAPSLTYLVRLLGYGAPHLAQQTQAALRLAREQLASCRIDGTTWYWPADENPRSRRHAFDERLRLLAPFDPVVWDRRRFTLLWGWTYKFEAYTPPARRQLGYYALPMLWQGQVIGWANLQARDGRLEPSFGYVAGAAPGDAAFRSALDEELQRMELFLAPR